MPGELSLSVLLSTLKPTLHAPTYVFTTIPKSEFTAPFPMPLASIQMMFHEAEGVTLIVERSLAEQRGLEYTFPCRMITLDVHSSLEAVGFMAVITARLKELGMGVNPVSGYFHDHLFVPEEKAEEAVKALERLARENTSIPNANTGGASDMPTANESQAAPAPGMLPDQPVLAQTHTSQRGAFGDVGTSEPTFSLDFSVLEKSDFRQ